MKFGALLLPVFVKFDELKYKLKHDRIFVDMNTVEYDAHRIDFQ